MILYGTDIEYNGYSFWKVEVGRLIIFVVELLGFFNESFV